MSKLQMNLQSLLSLIQLVSPALPVGAYTYSEGLETLSQLNLLSAAELENWLRQELRYGAIRVEAAVLVRVHRAVVNSDVQEINHWNQWLSAFRETEEIRQQSWQMGRALARLLGDLQPQTQAMLHQCTEPLNFATAFALASVTWKIDPITTVLGYLQSWATNLVNAGVRLVPLGQTQGQQILLNLAACLEATAVEALELSNSELECWSWGVSLASMNHETLYSRLFRS
jgi:urease accessory protein